MSDAPIKSNPTLLQKLTKHGAWIVLALVVLLVVVVRVRLREMPLERDEGEYAYAGQLMLQGIPPYKLAYNMKLSGTYAAYAFIMAIFGQTPSGIHIGFMLVNIACIVLVFFLGRRLLDQNAGAAAAVAYAVLSLSPSVAGLSAHATHFVVLPMLGGCLVLLRALEKGSVSDVHRDGPSLAGATTETKFLRRNQGSDVRASGAETVAQATSPSLPQSGGEGRGEEALIRRLNDSSFRRLLFLSGFLFGLGFVMKQHGVMFCIFAFGYLAWIRYSVQKEQFEWSKIRARQQSFDSWKYVTELGAFGVGVLVPYVIACIVLAAAGVFPQFWFWTVDYAARYVLAPSAEARATLFRDAVNIVTSPNLFFWLLAIFGAFLMWGEKRLKQGKIFLAAWLVFSFISICIGGYFREHYFVLILPVVSILAGVAVSRGLYLLKRKQTAERFIAIPALGLLLIGIGSTAILHGDFWFGLSPDKTMRQIYGSNLFPEAVELGNYLRTNATANATIAVVGSEPEIYFYAKRHSATGYIYMYPLMESHPYAMRMQEEMIKEVEAAKPDYIVYVDTHDSWLQQPSSNTRILDWWKDYWNSRYDLIRSVDVEAEKREGEDESRSQKLGYILLLRKKS